MARSTGENKLSLLQVNVPKVMQDEGRAWEGKGKGAQRVGFLGRILLAGRSGPAHRKLVRAASDCEDSQCSFICQARHGWYRMVPSDTAGWLSCRFFLSHGFPIHPVAAVGAKFRAATCRASFQGKMIPSISERILSFEGDRWSIVDEDRWQRWPTDDEKRDTFK